MSQLIKNILILAVLAGVAAVGYFLFVAPDNSPLSLSSYEAMSTELLASTQLFIERRQTLESLTLDLAIFNDERFISLQSYATEVPDQPVGKNNLFNEAASIPSQ